MYFPSPVLKTKICSTSTAPLESVSSKSRAPVITVPVNFGPVIVPSRRDGDAAISVRRLADLRQPVELHLSFENQDAAFRVGDAVLHAAIPRGVRKRAPSPYPGLLPAAPRDPRAQQPPPSGETCVCHCSCKYCSFATAFEAATSFVAGRRNRTPRAAPEAPSGRDRPRPPCIPMESPATSSTPASPGFPPAKVSRPCLRS